MVVGDERSLCLSELLEAKADLLIDEEKYECGAQHYAQALDEMRNIPNHGIVSECLLLRSIGDAMFNLNRYDRSLKYHTELLKLAEHSQNKKFQVFALEDMIEDYTKLGDEDSVRQYRAVRMHMVVRFTPYSHNENIFCMCVCACACVCVCVAHSAWIL